MQKVLYYPLVEDVPVAAAGCGDDDASASSETGYSVDLTQIDVCATGKKKLDFDQNFKISLHWVVQLLCVSRRFRDIMLAAENDTQLWCEFARCAQRHVRIFDSHPATDYDLYRYNFVYVQPNYHKGPLRTLKPAIWLPLDVLQQNTRTVVKNDTAIAEVSYFAAVKDLIQARQRMIQRVREHRIQVQKAAKKQVFRNKLPTRILSTITLSLFTVLLSLSFILITIRQAIEWTWINDGPQSTPAHARLALQVLMHVSFVPLLLAPLVLFFAFFVTAIMFRNVKHLIPIPFVLVIMATIVMIYLNNAVIAWMIPWPVVLSPLILTFFLVSISQFINITLNIIRRLRHRNRYLYGRSLQWPILWSLYGFLLTAFLVLVSARLQSLDGNFHAGYTYIPLYLFCILVFIGATLYFIELLPHYSPIFQRPYEAALYVLVGIAFPIALTISSIFSIVWNSYAICIGAILPSLVFALTSLLLLGLG